MIIRKCFNMGLIQRGSANHLLHHTIIKLSLQHLLYLLSCVVIQVFKAKLLAYLLTGHKFTFNSQPAVRHSLPAIVTHLLPPLSSLPKLFQSYFFSRQVRSFTLLASKEIGPIFLANVSLTPLMMVEVASESEEGSSVQAYSKQKLSYYSTYFSITLFMRPLFSTSSAASVLASISLNFLMISALGCFLNFSIFSEYSALRRSIAICFSSQLSLISVSLDLSLVDQQDIKVLLLPQQSSLQESSPLSESESSSSLEQKSLSQHESSKMCSSQQSILKRLRPSLSGLAIFLCFLRLFLFQVSNKQVLPPSRMKSSIMSCISCLSKPVVMGVRIRCEGS